MQARKPSNGIRVRALDGDDELIAAAKLFRIAMVGLPNIGPLGSDLVAEIFEPGRAFGAFAGERLIGTTDSYTSVLVAPGGVELPHAAVTRVGVLPTHTRKGAATALLTAQLGDARSRGEVVASLRASDARIYERFGYGVATLSATLELDRAAASLRAPLRKGADARLVDVEKSWALLPAIYDRGRRRAVAIARPRYWWGLQERRSRGSEGPAYVAVCGPEGGETGYVRYRPIGLDNWFSSSRRTIVVDDFIAEEPEAYLVLVRHLLSVDLVHYIVFPDRPVDDPLPELFDNRRAVRVSELRDETWLRILDVPAALASRSYAGDRNVVLEVVDPILPENNARFRISREGARETDAPHDVRADISSLAVAYLGGGNWWRLAQAGRIEARNRKGVAALDELFATTMSPHAGTMF